MRREITLLDQFRFLRFAGVRQIVRQHVPHEAALPILFHVRGGEEHREQDREKHHGTTQPQLTRKEHEHGVDGKKRNLAANEVPNDGVITRQIVGHPVRHGRGKRTTEGVADPLPRRRAGPVAVHRAGVIVLWRIPSRRIAKLAGHHPTAEYSSRLPPTNAVRACQRRL